jgi:hypothetical protein
MWGYVASVDNLFWGPLVWDSRATAKRLITEGRLPVPGDHKLGAIQKLGSGQEGPRKIGPIEHRLEKVCALQAGTREVRPVQVRPSKIGATKIGSRKIEPAQIEPSQPGRRQVCRPVVFRTPRIPRCGATAEPRDTSSFDIFHPC